MKAASVAPFLGLGLSSSAPVEAVVESETQTNESDFDYDNMVPGNRPLGYSFSLINNRTTSVSPTVTVTKDDRTVYETAFDLEARDGQNIHRVPPGLQLGAAGNLTVKTHLSSGEAVEQEWYCPRKRVPKEQGILVKFEEGGINISARRT